MKTYFTYDAAVTNAKKVIIDIERLPKPLEQKYYSNTTRSEMIR